MSKLPLLTTMASLVLIALARGEKFEVRNIEGRALMIELLSLENDKVTFTTAQGGKQHTLALDQFDADSREKIQAAAKALKSKVPAITSDVTTSNRRTKDDNGRESQAVIAKLRIRNPDTKTAFPESTGTLVYFGSNPRLPDQFQILSLKSFTVSVPPNDSFEKEFGGVTLSSGGGGGRGGRGFGGMGGTEYETYLLVITGPENQILHTKTSSVPLRSAIQRDPTLATRLLQLTTRDMLDKSFEKIEPRRPERPE